MKIMKFCLMTSLAFGLPFAATAQQDVAKASPSDIQYCHALSHAYSYMWSNNEGMPVAEAFALGQCDTDTKKTIARRSSCRRATTSRSRQIQTTRRPVAAHRPRKRARMRSPEEDQLRRE